MIKEEKIVASLVIISLVLMASYVFLRLVILKKPSIFVETPLSCNLTSCNQCLGSAKSFTNHQATLLRYALVQQGCQPEEIDKSLSWCLSHCQSPQTEKGKYHCRAVFYQDSGCKRQKYQVEFSSPTDRTEECTPISSGSQVINCQLSE